MKQQGGIGKNDHFGKRQKTVVLFDSAAFSLCLLCAVRVDVSETSQLPGLLFAEMPIGFLE